MPNIEDYEDEAEWMGACVPMMTGEGKDKDQAVAACTIMWEKKAAKSTDDVRVLVDGKELQRWTNVETPAAKTESLEDLTSDIRDAFSRQYGPYQPMAMPDMQHPYVEETYPGYVIACVGEQHYRINYATENSKVTFDPRDLWQVVEEKWVDVKKNAPAIVNNYYGSVTLAPSQDDDALKIGRRNSHKDQTALQNAHDALVNVGAVCGVKGPSGKNIEIDDSLVSFGSEVKATKLDDGSVKLAGYLVRFSTENDPDLTGEFFTKDTDFGSEEKSISWFNHCLPVSFAGKSVRYGEMLSSKANLTKDDIGIFAEIILKARNAYEEEIAKLGLAGKLGWSSGTAPHLVDKKTVKNGAVEITRWILGLDASLTPTPAEPRNAVMPIKSLFSPELAAVAEADVAKPVTKTQPKEVKTRKESDMDENDLKSIVDSVVTKLGPAIETASKTAAESAVKAYQEANEPALKAGNIGAIEDEADRAARLNPFKSHEFLWAVKQAAITPYDIDKRLLPLRDAAKATGMAEAQPSQAGFLVPQQTAPGIVEKMYATGTLLSLFTNRDPVQGNNMTYNLVDETSRANGSRYGGLQGYWTAEGGSLTGTKPKFRQLELKLKKVTALCVATDEQLNDAAALDSFLMRNVPDELRFKVEDAIINGDGVGKPRGILGCPAFVSAVRTDASEIDPYDIGRMWALRWAGAKDYIWVGNQGIFPQMLNLAIGQQPVFLPPGGLGGLPYATLLGRPYYDIEYAPALGTLGDLMLISPSQYQMIEKAGGVQSATSIHVYFTTEEQAYRFSLRIDGAPTWDSTLTGFDTVARSPYVGLAATT